ncbi:MULTISPECIES: hypothetical protein [unclassified Streptomyces]|uniref:hypothetical protein n=1 Tax=unclassified Streptomyces TaxID=2593676 RepID=UPI0023671A1B|nr:MULTISPECIES: hypothetical protein [unclassified Streptomyces]MDF3142484.1 hypothetical protein [Streptomyces sp. T21Q-yed]WDF43907.1 hypothetical protein PBV52_47555 [Streptomyces sp. T12]
MDAVIASLAGVLILAGIVYDIARLITPTSLDVHRWPVCVDGAPSWPKRNGGSWACAFTTMSTLPPTSAA